MKYIKTYDNVQLANKLYFTTDKLDKQDKDYILTVTRGDQTTKLISDIYFFHKQHNWNFDKVKKELFQIHKDLVEYNKNVLPIKDFDLYNTKNKDYYYILLNRHKIIENLKKLPSVAIRNLKNDIRTERDEKEMHTYDDHLSYFLALYSMLGNRDNEMTEKIMKKMFKSNITLDKLINFVDDKENLLGGVDFNRDTITELVEDSYGDMSIIFDKNDVLVIKVESADAIKEIGCNSLWCFTYGENNYHSWNNFSYNGIVYVIINLKESSESEEFMWVLITPLEKKYGDNDNYPLHNMANDNYYDPYTVLKRLIGDKKTIKKLFTFDYEPYESIHQRITKTYEEFEIKTEYVIHTADDKKTMIIWCVEDPNSSTLYFKKMYKYYKESNRLTKYGNDENYTRVDKDDIARIQQNIIFTSDNIQDCIDMINILSDQNKYNI
jgi:hypothetical protein